MHNQEEPVAAEGRLPSEADAETAWYFDAILDAVIQEQDLLLHASMGIDRTPEEKARRLALRQCSFRMEEFLDQLDKVSLAMRETNKMYAAFHPPHKKPASSVRKAASSMRLTRTGMDLKIKKLGLSARDMHEGQSADELMHRSLTLYDTVSRLVYSVVETRARTRDILEKNRRGWTDTPWLKHVLLHNIRPWSEQNHEITK